MSRAMAPAELGGRDVELQRVQRDTAVDRPFVEALLDPADRLILATARVHDATLVTADKTLLGWRGRIKRHNARR